jgi:hypothetical protein
MITMAAPAYSRSTEVSLMRVKSELYTMSSKSLNCSAVSAAAGAAAG